MAIHNVGQAKAFNKQLKQLLDRKDTHIPANLRAWLVASQEALSVMDRENEKLWEEMIENEGDY